MSEPQYKVEWLSDPGQFRGDIAATISVDGDQWRRAGAKFTSVEDEQTGPVDVAAGTVEFPGGAVEFGLLDYGAGTTYLLTPASGPAREELASLALLALAETGALSLDDVLDEENPYEGASLTERIAVLEQWAGEAMAEAESSAVPVAVDVEIPELRPNAGRQVHGRRLWGKGPIHVGTIKAFSPLEGGVISPEGGGKEVFVSPDSVSDVNVLKIAAGAKVIFRYTIEPSKSEIEIEDPDLISEAESAEEV